MVRVTAVTSDIWTALGSIAGLAAAAVGAFAAWQAKRAADAAERSVTTAEKGRRDDARRATRRRASQVSVQHQFGSEYVRWGDTTFDQKPSLAVVTNASTEPIYEVEVAHWPDYPRGDRVRRATAKMVGADATVEIPMPTKRKLLLNTDEEIQQSRKALEAEQMEIQAQPHLYLRWSDTDQNTWERFPNGSLVLQRDAEAIHRAG